MNTTSNFLQNALLHPFQDKNWGTKLLIGGALLLASMLIPVIPALFVLGYLYRIQRRVIIDKSGPQLPEWEDWGQLLQDGLKYLGAILVYMLPALLLMIGGYVFMMFSPMLITMVAEVGEVGEKAASVLGILLLLGFMGGVLAMLLGSVLGIAIGILVPAGLAHMSAQDRFGAAFEINVWIKNWRANAGGYVLAFVVVMGLSWALTFILSFTYFAAIFCCLLPAVAISYVSYYLGVVSANLYANAYINGQTEAGLPEVEA
ncbi:MAG: DUF4013 domain-containing protein [Chloroflexota bacterium]